jgi:DNA-directed RNA polymerase beta' subunit
MENNVFDSIKIGLASPEQIRAWSYGEVKKPENNDGSLAVIMPGREVKPGSEVK